MFLCMFVEGEIRICVYLKFRKFSDSRYILIFNQLEQEIYLFCQTTRRAHTFFCSTGKEGSFPWDKAAGS